MPNNRRTHAQFLNEISGRNIIPLEEYVIASKKIKFKCSIDGHVWETMPSVILAGSGCPVCGRRKISNSRKRTNKIIEKNGDVLHIDVSTESFNNSIMKIFENDWARLVNIIDGGVSAKKGKTSTVVYAWCQVGGKQKFVHNLIRPEYKMIDHINGDGLDNRDVNLRECTRSQNCCNIKIRSDNKSGVTGLSWSNRLNKWIVQIRVNNNKMHIGCFENKSDAIIARKQAEKKYHGEFACRS